MSELVANCPRCKSKSMTFDLLNDVALPVTNGWQRRYETFCVCRACYKPTMFVLSQKSANLENYLRGKALAGLKQSVNEALNVDGYVSLKDESAETPPDYLPADIETVFREGAACFAIGCYNAAGTMFRLCIDLATKAMLPDDDGGGLNQRTRRSLGLRLPWLFDNNVLPEALRELSICIKDDGNDGAHEGTLSKEDAEDLLDFTFVLLERIFTEPQRIELARERRVARRARD